MNKYQDDGGAAFPTDGRARDGMTLREYYAGKALGNLCFALHDGKGEVTTKNADKVAAICVQYADTLIAELKKGITR